MVMPSEIRRLGPLNAHASPATSTLAPVAYCDVEKLEHTRPAKALPILCMMRSSSRDSERVLWFNSPRSRSKTRPRNVGRLHCGEDDGTKHGGLTNSLPPRHPRPFPAESPEPTDALAWKCFEWEPDTFCSLKDCTALAPTEPAKTLARLETTVFPQIALGPAHSHDKGL